MRAKKRDSKQRPPETPRTGVGTPDSHAEAGGMALGADTGDVGTPHEQLAGGRGDTYGTPALPDSVPIQSREGEQEEDGQQQAA